MSEPVMEGSEGEKGEGRKKGREGEWEDGRMGGWIGFSLVQSGWLFPLGEKAMQRKGMSWNDHLQPPPHRWVNSLQPARVTRWGGMISTPDAVLQAVIKRSLVESGCPASIVNELIENAHERSWPQGLATLETRQMNRRYYENYVAKRIPGKQAVVVMACENQHMGDDMVQEPGLVMIFAHGVEEI